MEESLCLHLGQKKKKKLQASKVWLQPGTQVHFEFYKLKFESVTVEEEEEEEEEGYR